MKTLFAFIALALSVSLSAQDDVQLISEVDNDVSNKCIYSAETRAMMRVDKIVSLMSEVKDAKKKKMVKFFTEQIQKIDSIRAIGEKIDWNEIREETNEKLHKILGDKSYIEYLENQQERLLKRCKHNRSRGQDNLTTKESK